jgi:hypothetical protein
MSDFIICKLSRLIKPYFISVCLIFIIIICILASCSKNKYNAIMYSQSSDWIQSSFLEENKVRGAEYENPLYTDDYAHDAYYYDETSPDDRIFIIDNIDTYNTIFNENMLTIDFDKQIIYLYTFASTSNRDYLIDKISIKEEQLNIYYKLKKSNMKDATNPHQRCLIVVMDRTNTSSVKFIEKN